MSFFSYYVYDFFNEYITYDELGSAHLAQNLQDSEWCEECIFTMIHNFFRVVM